MVRRFLLGILWSIAIYFGACFFVGAVAGAAACAYDPVHATAAGMEAGAIAVASMRCPYCGYHGDHERFSPRREG